MRHERRDRCARGLRGPAHGHARDTGAGVGGDAGERGAAAMTRRELERRAEALATARVPFVSATVVRVERPASVRPGAAAIILADGSIDGFVGGACAESSVRLQALRVLETGEAVLMRIAPDGGGGEAGEGTVTVENPCLSGGSL